MTTFQEFLKANRDADLLRVVTAGSVDDGKSTLIGRLLHDSMAVYEDQLAAISNRDASSASGPDLALLLDGLKDEREQGITIDVAYRYFKTPRRRFIIADCPGHEQYTRNMVTGASTADVAVLLIDAANGITTQSRRHAFIVSLLGISHVIVAINKMDLVDYSKEVFESIRDQYSAFAERLDIGELTFIPVCALRGDNVVEQSERMPWYTGLTFLAQMESVYHGGSRNPVDFRFPVQRVCRPDASFRGYAGEIASGILRPGDEITVLPAGMVSRVERIVTQNGDLDSAHALQSVTVCIEDELDISRGDMLVHTHNQPLITSSLEAMLVWMDSESLAVNKPYVLKHTTRSVKGYVSKLHYAVDPDTLRRLQRQELELNEIGRVDIQLYKPVMCDEYAKNRTTGSFVLIDPDTNNTVAAGMIIMREKHGGLHAAAYRSVPVSRNITMTSGRVDASARFDLLKQKPACVWLTGLSGSGKSTIAYALEERLMSKGHLCYVLDGDNIRHGLNRDLGFSPEDRSENIRRIAEVARLLNETGVIVITAFISPYRADREKAAEIVGQERFAEVFVDAPVDVCEERDPKGLYARARKGEISDFTGISAPYEAPADPVLHVRTDTMSLDDSVDAVISYLESEFISD